MTGLGPVTSSLPMRCATTCATSASYVLARQANLIYSSMRNYICQQKKYKNLYLFYLNRESLTEAFFRGILFPRGDRRYFMKKKRRKRKSAWAVFFKPIKVIFSIFLILMILEERRFFTAVGYQNLRFLGTGDRYYQYGTL